MFAPSSYIWDWRLRPVKHKPSSEGSICVCYLERDMELGAEREQLDTIFLEERFSLSWTILRDSFIFILYSIWILFRVVLYNILYMFLVYYRKYLGMVYWYEYSMTYTSRIWFDLFEAGSHFVVLAIWSSVCRPDWPWTSDLFLPLTSQVLKLKPCTIRSCVILPFCFLS